MRMETEFVTIVAFITGAIWLAVAQIMWTQTEMESVAIIRSVKAEEMDGGTASKPDVAGTTWMRTETVSVITMHPAKAVTDAAPNVDAEMVSGAGEEGNKRNHYAERAGYNQSH